MSGHLRQPFERAYKMGLLLGKGGFGTVYAGERTKDSLPVAIKVIKKAKITQWCTVSFFHSPTHKPALEISRGRARARTQSILGTLTKFTTFLVKVLTLHLHFCKLFPRKWLLLQFCNPFNVCVRARINSATPLLCVQGSTTLM